MKYEITLAATERITLETILFTVTTSFPPEVHSINIISHNYKIDNLN